MKVGLLYPSSNAHAGIGLQLMAGLKKCLTQSGLAESITISPDNIGFGGAEKEVYQKAEKLLVADGVDVLVAFIDLKVLTVLEPLIFATGKLMLVVNAGANYPQNWVPQPNIIFLTLQHSFLCWLNGQRAAKNENKNGALATSFYDCGYLHSTAMVKNFVQSGGSITYNYINKQAYDNNFTISELVDFLSSPNNNASNLLCVFDTAPAVLFYERLAQFKTPAALRCFVSPMMLEEEALKKMPQPYAYPVQGYLPWHPSVQNEANKNFVVYCSSQTKQNIHIFALLGWETALLLQQIYLQENLDFNNGEAIVASLAQQPINSPRGILQLDTETNYFVAPFLQCHLSPNEPGPQMSVVQDFKKDWEAFTATPVEGISSGWSNTYLCY